MWSHPERWTGARRSVVLALAGALVVVVGLVDFATGRKLSISVFYLAPIGIAGWYAGRVAGVVAALASSGVWLAADRFAGVEYAGAFLPLWNTGVRLTFFLVTNHLLTALRERLLSEEALARTDALTGLVNNRQLYEVTAAEIERAARYRHPLTVAILDLDNFKAVNDLRGHAAGDEVLRQVGGVLGNALRGVDVAARTGGDEFALLLPETDLQEARAVLERLRLELLELSEREGLPVTFSIGATTFARPPQGAAEAFQLADGLMYRAKQAGKNRLLVEPHG